MWVSQFIYKMGDLTWSAEARGQSLLCQISRPKKLRWKRGFSRSSLKAKNMPKCSLFKFNRYGILNTISYPFCEIFTYEDRLYFAEFLLLLSIKISAISTFQQLVNKAGTESGYTVLKRTAIL